MDKTKKTNLLHIILFTLESILLIIVIVFVAKCFKTTKMSIKLVSMENQQTIITQTAPNQIPTKQEFQELEQSYIELSKYLENEQILNNEIQALYEQVISAKVCSIANRNFNKLEERYGIYKTQVKEIQAHIAECEEKYNNYKEKINNIPQYAVVLRREKEKELEAKVETLYKEATNQKEKYIEEEAKVDEFYTSSKLIANQLFNAYFPLMCQIVNAESGNCEVVEHYYVANVIENRIANPDFPNTLYEVVYAPGQYSPTWNGRINLIPSEQVKKDVENYLRGRAETGMPENVLYQARFSQGRIWKQMPSGHYYCYG